MLLSKGYKILELSLGYKPLYTLVYRVSTISTIELIFTGFDRFII